MQQKVIIINKQRKKLTKIIKFLVTSKNEQVLDTYHVSFYNDAQRILQKTNPFSNFSRKG